MKIIVIVTLICVMVFSDACMVCAQDANKKMSRQLVNQKITLIQNRMSALEEKIERTLSTQDKILEDLKILKIRISRSRGRRGG